MTGFLIVVPLEFAGVYIGFKKRRARKSVTRAVSEHQLARKPK